MKTLLILVLLMTAPTALAASTPLTVERVFASPALSGPAARGVQVSPDGKWLSWLKPSAKNQFKLDLWAAPTTGGEAKILVAGEAVEPDGVALTEEEKSRRERQRVAQVSGVVSYDWDEGARNILIGAGGKLWLADPASGKVRELDAGGAGAVAPQLSPKGGYVSFSRAHNLYLLPLAGGPARALTTDGKDSVSYGLAEFIAQEEMGRFEGVWWAPDEHAIAYQRTDESGVPLIERLEIGAAGATIAPQRYPRAGAPNAKVELFVQSLNGGSAVKVDLGPDPDIYLARVHWSADGRDLYVERQNRGQTERDLLRVDPATGAARVIIAEKRAPWIDLDDDFRALKDGTFLWGSARTGAHHLYLYGRDGKLIHAVTSGPVPFAGGGGGAGLKAPGVAGVDEARGLVYLLASGETPLERQLYVVSYRNPGPPRAITTGHGWWTAMMPKAANVFVGYFSDPDTPPQTGLYDVSGKRLAWIEENRLDASHPFFPFKDRYPAPEFGELKADDGQTLHTVLLRPVGFDPKKTYPAIVEVYGGPHVQTVSRAWRSPQEKLYLEAGYVVFQLDNRGSANRDERFQTAIARRLGSVEVDDQVKGLEYLRSLPFVDGRRIGVSGWSYGGYMTLRLLTDPRTGLKAGAAGAPPTDWREYDTHYTERYMGLPKDEKAAYDAASVIPRLKDLKGRLLLLQGMADDNVQIGNSFAVMADLQGRGVPFDLMLYPGERHGVRGESRQVQLWRTFLEFFGRELGK